jgi:hypothetical protein
LDITPWRELLLAGERVVIGNTAFWLEDATFEEDEELPLPKVRQKRKRKDGSLLPAGGVILLTKMLKRAKQEVSEIEDGLRLLGSGK